MEERLSEIKGASLTGASYMLPSVITGGILIALSSATGGYDIPNSVEEYGNLASVIFWLGKKAFALMVSVLGVYVAYFIADKLGIAADVVGGALTDMRGSGFLGALIAGITAGYLVNLLKRINLLMTLKSLLPALVIPIAGAGTISLIMVYVIGVPPSALATALTDMLNSLGTGNPALLGVAQGCMPTFNMGSPCNKVAYTFALAVMDVGNYIPMAANFIGSMTPLLAIAVAALITKNKSTERERAAAPGLFAGTFSVVTEFAIPFVAASPLTVIPSLTAGSAVGCALPYVFGLTARVPHGGLFVLFALNDALLLIVTLLIAGAVSTTLLILLRKPAVEAEE